MPIKLFERALCGGHLSCCGFWPQSMDAIKANCTAMQTRRQWLQDAKSSTLLSLSLSLFLWDVCRSSLFNLGCCETTLSTVFTRRALLKGGGGEGGGEGRLPLSVPKQAAPFHSTALTCPSLSLSLFVSVCLCAKMCGPCWLPCHLVSPRPFHFNIYPATTPSPYPSLLRH